MYKTRWLKGVSAAASATQPAAALARPDLQRGMTVSGARVRGACVCVCVVRVRARGACARVRVPQAQLGEQQPGVRARLGLRQARARRRQRRRALGQRALDAVHARRLRADRRWKYTVRIVYSQRATTATDERATLRLTDTSVSNAPGVVVLRVGQRVQFRVPVVLRFELRICTAHQR